MELTQEILDVELVGKDEKSIMIDADDMIENIVKALSSSTRRKILMSIKQEPADVSKIAAELDMTEANISAQIKKLEGAGLIRCNYEAGQHGVRKISSVKYDQLVLRF